MSAAARCSSRTRCSTASACCRRQYFFSFEDLAFCLSARDAGFAVGVCGAAVAYHKAAAPLAPRRHGDFISARATSCCWRRASGARHRRTERFALVRSSCSTCSMPLRASGGSIAGRLAAVARGARDHAGGRSGGVTQGCPTRDRRTFRSASDCLLQIPHFGRQEPDFLDQPLNLLPLPRDDHRKVEQRGEDASDEREQQDGRRIVDAEPVSRLDEGAAARTTGRTVRAAARIHSSEYSSVSLRRRTSSMTTTIRIALIVAPAISTRSVMTARFARPRAAARRPSPSAMRADAARRRDGVNVVDPATRSRIPTGTSSARSPFRLENSRSSASAYPVG